MAAPLVGSALTGNETIVALPSSLTIVCAGPNRPSAANRLSNAPIADLISGPAASPSTTTSIGELKPPENSVARISKARRDGASSGMELTPAVPVLMLRYDEAA